MLVRLDADPEVTAIVPTLGIDEERVVRCVDSLAEQDARLAVVVVVNSAVPHGLDGRLPDQVRIEQTGLNLGWAGGLAFGRALVRTELIWQVQDDTVALPGCLRALIEALGADPAIALVCPVGLGADGTVPLRSLGGYLDQDGRLTSWYPPMDTPPDHLDGTEQLSYLSSRGNLIRTAAWDRIGGPDPRYYPVMYADVDFCDRLRAEGYRFAVVPSATIHHQVNGSTTPLFARFLAEHNAEVFRRQRYPHPGDPAMIEVHPQVTSDRIAIVAGAASQALLALGRTLEQTAADLRAQLAHTGSRVTELEQQQTRDHDQLRQLQEMLAELDSTAESLRSANARLRRRVRRLRARLRDQDPPEPSRPTQLVGRVAHTLIRSIRSRS